MTTLTTLTLPVLPLTTGVVLPQMVVTVALETDEARAAADAAIAGPGQLLLVPRLQGRYATVGAVATIETSGELPNGGRALVLRATGRAVIGVGVPGSGTALWVQAEPAQDDHVVDAPLAVLATEYRATVELLLERRGMQRFAAALVGIDDPGTLADTVNDWPELSFERRIELLEAIDPAQRLTLALGWIREALADAELKDKIRHDVSDGIERQQREFLLRQQMAAIRKELGDTDQSGDAIARYRSRIEALPTAVRTAATTEVDRLERMGEQSVESGWIRGWLDTVLDVPWTQRSTDHLDVTTARAVLDADTTGLDEAKERIVEWLAVRKLRSERHDDRPLVSELADGSVLITPQGGVLSTGGNDPEPAPVPVVHTARRGDGVIIVLVGPPGVGKTSLGESVARAMGRSFVRLALGGVRDEAEIRGHRRTYVGAQPGRIVRALREAKTMNPVILLDEIDKISAGGWSGDPSAALLEVLDPAQNHTFRDHYLDVDLDLSDVVFLATANSLDTVPAPLLDRMEIIAVDGYTDDEKVAIVRNHLLARQLSLSGLRTDELSIHDDAIRAVVEGYTREAGVRSLERALAKLLRKIALQIAGGTADVPVSVTNAVAVAEFLGRPKLVREERNQLGGVPGVATGLAVTGAGGDVLFVEATAFAAGTPDVGLTVTGQLGDVMKESASIALSYVRAHAEQLGVDASALEGKRIHVHFPAGSVPKDGPSAGITMTTALVSLLTGRPVDPSVGMTGEVTLSGRVLPIGGLKQKLLAAHRAGLRMVIVPERNGPDLDDVPQDIRDCLDIRLASNVVEVVDWALLPLTASVN